MEEVDFLLLEARALTFNILVFAYILLRMSGILSERNCDVVMFSGFLCIHEIYERCAVLLPHRVSF